MSDVAKADFIAKQFILELPLLHKEPTLDAHQIAQNDPAASGIDEVIIAYPWFTRNRTYRLAHSLQAKHPLIPRMRCRAHSTTGIDIHLKATIGKEFL